jgi:hypothetical protein
MALVPPLRGAAANKPDVEADVEIAPDAFAVHVRLVAESRAIDRENAHALWDGCSPQWYSRGLTGSGSLGQTLSA